MSESLKSRREYQRLLKEVQTARAQPDYVPEFPPSQLIDDSAEACARAGQWINRISRGTSDADVRAQASKVGTTGFRL